MATITATQARFIGRAELSGSRRPFGGYGITGIQEAASQTWGVGAPIRPDDTSGKIEIAPDADAVASLYGQAEEAASGTTGNTVYGFYFSAGDRFVMNLESNGSGVATALGQLGDKVNFNIVSGKLLADVLPGSSAAVETKPWGQIDAIYCVEHGYLDGDALGDTNGRVIVRLGGGYLGQSA
jgi:hypothetical protein